MTSYLELKKATCTAKTVSSLATRLMHFGRFLTEADPGLDTPGRARPATSHRALPRIGRDAADSRKGTVITPGEQQRRVLAAGNPHRHHRLGLGGGPVPAADLPRRHPEAAQGPAALPARRRRPAARRGTARVAEPAARLRAAPAAGLRAADRRAARPRARLRARGPRLRRLAESATRQARQRADGAARRGSPRPHRHNHRDPLAGQPLPHPRYGGPPSSCSPTTAPPVPERRARGTRPRGPGRRARSRRPHQLRHTYATAMERRGVASDATFRRLCEEGGVRVPVLPASCGRGCLAAGHAVVSGVPVPSLRQMAGCGIKIGCIR